MVVGKALLILSVPLAPIVAAILIAAVQGCLRRQRVKVPMARIARHVGVWGGCGLVGMAVALIAHAVTRPLERFIPIPPRTGWEVTLLLLATFAPLIVGVALLWLMIPALARFTERHWR